MTKWIVTDDPPWRGLLTVATTDGRNLAYFRNEADAIRCVKAVNSVEKMREALEELVAAQDANDEGQFDSPKMRDVAMQKARAALAKEDS